MPPWRSKTTASARRRAERRGQWGEVFAALYLRAKLYRIRARRVKTPVGEIDLVAHKGGRIVFVEVKTRATDAEAAQALAAVNRARIARAAQYWLGRHPELGAFEMRFDVIFLAPFAWPRHVRHAFDAQGKI